MNNWDRGKSREKKGNGGNERRRDRKMQQSDKEMWLRGMRKRRIFYLGKRVPESSCWLTFPLPLNTFIWIAFVCLCTCVSFSNLRRLCAARARLSLSDLYYSKPTCWTQWCYKWLLWIQQSQILQNSGKGNAEIGYHSVWITVLSFLSPLFLLFASLFSCHRLLYVLDKQSTTVLKRKIETFHAS